MRKTVEVWLCHGVTPVRLLETLPAPVCFSALPLTLSTPAEVAGNVVGARLDLPVRLEVFTRDDEQTILFGRGRRVFYTFSGTVTRKLSKKERNAFE